MLRYEWMAHSGSADLVSERAAGTARNRQSFCDLSASGSRGPVAVRVGEGIVMRPSKSTVHGGR